MTSKNKIVATLADSSISDGYTLLDFRVSVIDTTGATGTTAGGATGPTGSIATYDPTYIAIPWTGVTGSGPDPGDEAFCAVEFDRSIGTDTVFDLIRDRVIEDFGRNTVDGEASILSNGQQWNPSGAAWPSGPQGPNAAGAGNAYRLRFNADEILVRGWGHRGKKGDENPSRVLYKGDPIRPPRVPAYNASYTVNGTTGFDSGLSSGKGRILISRTQEAVKVKSLTATTMTCKLHFKTVPSTSGSGTTMGADWEYRLYAFDETTTDFDTTPCIWSTAIGGSISSKTAVSSTIDLSSTTQSPLTTPSRVVFMLGVRRINAGTLKPSNLGRLVRAVLVFE